MTKSDYSFTLPADHDHHRFMIQAMHEAQKAEANGEVPVGAVVVLKNRIIGRGHNQVELLSDPTAHAEMIALSAACNYIGEKYLSDCTMYVTLEPCPMCTGALIWSKLGQLVFGAQDSKAGACGSVFNIAEHPSMNHHIQILHGVMEQDSEALLQSFFKNLRNKNTES